MRPLFLHYPQCGTCRKAVKWLKENSIEVDARHIVEENPTVVELTEWIPKSGLPVSKFFNTSGQVYRQNNLKEVVKTASDSELIQLLSENGMLVKRPILVGENFTLVGFKEEEWRDALVSQT